MIAAYIANCTPSRCAYKALAVMPVLDIPIPVQVTQCNTANGAA